MATADVHAKTSGTQTDTGTEVEGRCAVCAHAWDDHDVIAARYCKATVAGDFSRGCVCVAVELPGPAR
jgi:hypothetical protein